MTGQSKLSRLPPYALPLLVALVLRAWAALWGWGFHARDDYFHLLLPALRWLNDPAFDWSSSGLPGAGIRSELLPRLTWLVLRLFSSLGVSEPSTMLRCLHLVYGVVGASMVPLTYLAAKRHLSAGAVNTAVWLSAAHFALPYVSTRFMPEAVAMLPLLAVYSCDLKSPKGVMWAVLWATLAMTLRPQTVVVFGVLAPMILWSLRDSPLRNRILVAGAVSSVGCLFAWGLLGWVTSGTWFGVEQNYVWVNLCSLSGEAQGYFCTGVTERGLSFNPKLSRSGFATYLLAWFFLSIPPATYWLVKYGAKERHRLAKILWPWLAFVVFHSLIAHKEERFMLPVLPLFLLALAAAVSRWRESWGGKTQKRERFAYGWLVGIHGVALVVALTASSQQNLKSALVSLHHRVNLAGLLVVGPEVQDYLLSRSEVEVRRTRKLRRGWIAKQTSDLKQRGIIDPFVLVTHELLTLTQFDLALNGLQCHEVEYFEGWWFDRVLYVLNRKHNQRRAPLILLRCASREIAALDMNPTHRAFT